MIERKYVGKLSKNALSIMNSLLKMDPKERITAKEALFHQYFDGIRNEEEEKSC
jgi:cyclin-dependent kinase-like